MVVADFFSFDEDEYKQRISSYTTERLVKQEVVKLRTQYMGSWSVGGGIGAAMFTFGASLAGSAYGGRRLYVANKKQHLIQDELTRRNVDLHEEQKRDFLIPLTAGLIGCGVTVGMEEVFMGATNVVADGLCAPKGSSAVQQVIDQPADALRGALAGAAEQVDEMGLAINNIGMGIIPGSDISSELLAANTTWIALPNGAQAAGFHAGMLLAQGAESKVAVNVVSQSAWQVMEMFDSTRKAISALTCRRLLGASSLRCDECTEHIKDKAYWHCCECDKDDFNICHECHLAGRRCRSSTHTMKRLQHAVDTDYDLDSKIPEPYQAGCESQHKSQIVKSMLLALPSFICSGCEARVSQGFWFRKYRDTLTGNGIPIGPC